MIKSYKIRLYPTKEQEQLMRKHVGCCRYIWNYMLDLQETRYKNGEKYLSHFDMNNLLKPLKNDGEHEWLKEVSNTSLQKVCGDLDKAYKDFFKKNTGHPKFKSKKKSKPSFPVRSDRASFYFKEQIVKIEKIGKVKYKSDFNIPLGKEAKFSNARISNIHGKWILTCGYECENQTFELTDKSMGIDLGIKDTAVVAYGDEQLVFHNINKSTRVRRLETKKKRIQRSISRKYEANKQGNRYIKTKNIERKEEKLRKIYAKLSNIRNNYTHQITHKLVELKPYRVVMEDLDVKDMMKNKYLAEDISKQNFYEFIRQMKYKCEYYGIEFIQVDRYYPSSKTCSCCGSIKKNLKLSDRVYICPECGAVIDRDYNAAINLMRYTA